MTESRLLKRIPGILLPGILLTMLAIMVGCSWEKVVIRRLERKPDDLGKALALILQSAQAKAAIMDGVLSDPSVMKSVYSYSLGRTFFSGSMSQEYIFLTDPKMTLLVLKKLLGAETVADLTKNLKCQKDTAYQFCDHDLGEYEDYDFAANGLEENEFNLYRMLQFSGLQITGTMNTYIYISNSDPDSFYVEGDGMVFVGQPAYNRIVAFGMYRIVSNGPYSITDLEESPFVDINVEVTMTTLMYRNFAEPTEIEPDDVFSDGRNAQHNILQYRIFLEDVEGEKDVFVIRQDWGHPIGIKIYGQNEEWHYEIIGCARFMAPHGIYKAMDMANRNLVRRPAPTRTAPAAAPDGWRSEDKIKVFDVCKQYPNEVEERTKRPGGA